jgi:thiol:disulfide interchange protein
MSVPQNSIHAGRIVLIATLLCHAWAFAAGLLPDRFDPQRDAAADVSTAVTLARVQHKRVIVDVGGEWCVWCHILDRYIAANEDVRRAVDDHYIWVKVNWSPQNRNEALLSRWPAIKGYPHLFVLDGQGRLLHSQDTDSLESGRSYDKDRMLDFLRRNAQP